MKNEKTTRGKLGQKNKDFKVVSKIATKINDYANELLEQNQRSQNKVSMRAINKVIEIRDFAVKKANECVTED